jgi:AraC-like DNA-binding protein
MQLAVFADPNAFSRAFRDWAKLQPKQWPALGTGPMPGELKTRGRLW